jgi:hypothetical protein
VCHNGSLSLYLCLSLSLSLSLYTYINTVMERKAWADEERNVQGESKEIAGFRFFGALRD